MQHQEHLEKDRKLRQIMLEQDSFTLTKQKHVHIHLCASIISQQLSTKVAAVIYARFLALFETKSPGPQEILDIPFEQLRSIGLSNSKTHYVRNVCAFFIQEKLSDKQIHRMKSEEIKSKLIEIKGVGKWTIEMLLMFTLGDEDVFAVDDLGIQQAMTKLYQLNSADKKQMKADMLMISEKWSPYRTYACLYLWRWKDKKE